MPRSVRLNDLGITITPTSSLIPPSVSVPITIRRTSGSTATHATIMLVPPPNGETGANAKLCAAAPPIRIGH